MLGCLKYEVLHRALLQDFALKIQTFDKLHFIFFSSKKRKKNDVGFMITFAVFLSIFLCDRISIWLGINERWNFHWEFYVFDDWKSFYKDYILYTYFFNLDYPPVYQHFCFWSRWTWSPQGWTLHHRLCFTLLCELTPWEWGIFLEAFRVLGGQQ